MDTQIKAILVARLIALHDRLSEVTDQMELLHKDITQFCQADLGSASVLGKMQVLVKYSNDMEKGASLSSILRAVMEQP